MAMHLWVMQKTQKHFGARDFSSLVLQSAACNLALARMDGETVGAVTGQCIAKVQHYTKSVL